MGGVLAARVMPSHIIHRPVDHDRPGCEVVCIDHGRPYESMTGD